MFINKFKQNPNGIASETDILATSKNGIFYCMDLGEVDKLITKFCLEKITDIGIDTLIMME